MKKKIGIVLVLVLILTACQLGNINKKEEMAHIQIFAMDTFMDLKVSGKNAQKAILEAEREINALERMLSNTIENSEISAINQNAGKDAVKVSDDTLYLLKEAREIYDFTQGAFDITIAPIIDVWGFTKEVKKVPDEETLKQKLDLVDMKKLQINEKNKTVFLEESGMAIDLGGIAKGYATDKVNEIFIENGITSSVISLGGNVSVTGKKEDGSKWKVAIQDPLNKEGYAGVLYVEDTSVVTSGGYQRFFEENGKTYHHIIDPKTGMPADTGLLSVTIVCKNSTKADGLSTSVFIAGLEKGWQMWKDSQDFGIVFITDKKEIYVTPDIADIFEIDANAGYTLCSIP
ncbi:MAG TPA: FAD:protein FMN transferase [Candidatus Coprocola pullicola]|nr:FAD:protein FMN transferase [Candidatus Coprocola pullicola]